jgi:hypothetical protein
LSNKELILQTLLENKWDDIDAIAKHAITENWFPEAEKVALLQYIKSRLRPILNQKDPSTGLPVHMSVVAKDLLTGKKKRVYKQLSLFTIDDYQEAFRYHRARGVHHQKILKALIDDCQKRLGVRLHLDLDIAV